MATPINTIYSWFETGDFPTQAQFQASWSSFWHKDETIPMTTIDGLSEQFGKYVLVSTFESHLNDQNAHPYLVKKNAANLSPTNINDWRTKLGVEDLPDNIATYDYDLPDHVMMKDGTTKEAGDLGKNIANSPLTSVAGAGMTLGAPYVWNTAGQPFSITNLPDKSADTTYNTLLVENASGQVAKSNGKPLIKVMPSLLTEAEKTAWKTEMNGGWTTNTMSVAFISHPVVVNNGISYLTLIGANLNLNPINFSIKLISQVDSSIYSIPNSQVILTSATELTIWYDFTLVPIGSYKMLLNNGISDYLTPTTVDIVLNLNPINISTNTWDITTYNGNTNPTIQQSNTSFSCQLSADVILPITDGKIALTATSSEICDMSEDFYIKFSLWNTGNTNSFFTLYGGLNNDIVPSNISNVIAGARCLDTHQIAPLSGGNVGASPSASNTIVLYKKGTFLTTIVKGTLGALVNTSTVSRDSSVPVKIKLVQINHANAGNVSNISIQSIYKL